VGKEQGNDKFRSDIRRVHDDMIRMASKTIGEKLTGSKAGMVRTVVLSATVGAGAAFGTYKLLRTGH
jgi:hypothetical protein